jgi:hypothetical protein
MERLSAVKAKRRGKLISWHRLGGVGPVDVVDLVDVLRLFSLYIFFSPA